MRTSVGASVLTCTLVLAVSCAASSPRPVASTADVAEPAPEAAEPECTLDLAAEPAECAEEPSPWEEPRELPPPLEPHEVGSAELRAVKGALAPAFAALLRAAPGINPVAELEGRPIGRSYNQLEARLGQGAVGEVLETLVYAHVRPAPGDFVFYVRVGDTPLRSAADLTASFDVEQQLAAPEQAALADLVAAIEAALTANPRLRAFQLQAGWADAVGAAYHGVAFVSPAGDEVLWVFTEEVWCEC